ncbi:aldo/keto reductase [Companilactobacillus keshanensis]|uniref:Aldo/keto reductase n=1 Tax=Companilactobacillus keshanensis TaxID=2486003 RepID=A0ABW4BSZ9_9LACO|nr:aldo/keto reductase [Companilactobacillus keshanensis]
MTQTYLTLNDGNKIPQFGLGVYQINGDAETEKTVAAALKLGYRHIDTAHAYQNERGVGAAVKKSGLKRNDVWLTSKLWPSDYGFDKTPVAIDKMLERLDTGYIDLLLLHQQFGDYVGAWKAMEQAVHDGKIRSIGFSNFDGERLDNLLDNVTIKPAIAQVELHPYYQQNELKSRLAQYDTKLESWYPLGHGDSNLINEPIFTELAKKYNKSNVQVILRWHIQSGNIVFPKTTNPQHMQDNFDIFDFELSASEMERINNLDNGKKYFNVPVEEAEKQFGDWIPED